MAVTFSNTNKPLNPRGQDASPLAYNRAALYSGKALSFDGSNDSVNLDGFTMSGDTGTFCFYADIDNDAYVFDMSPNRLVFLHNETSGQGIRVFNSTGWSNYGLVDRVGVLFYTIVCDGTSQSVFVNGQQVGDTQTIGSALNISSATQVKLGSNYINTGTYLNGQIAGFKIFNTALTPAQIADLYNNPEKIVPTGVDNTALKLWLPMMEGAGTTAYDGSGNGNHGTISGATYVNGVGAPVAQTSVIDWNKGTNKLPDSSDLENGTHWIRSGDTAVESGYSAPNGTNTAFKVTGTNDALVDQATAVATDYRAIWARTTSGIGTAKLTSYHGNTNNLFTITEEWQKFSVDSSISTGGGNFYVVDFRGSGTLNEVIVWQPHLADSESVLVPTIGTAQTTPVLLPAGLTTGRDITGVNLFENVRKQGALNLDGQSWAEVHDNASFDLINLTLEAWVNIKSGEAIKGILGQWSSSQGYMIYLATDSDIRFYINDGFAFFDSLTTGWHHIAAVYDDDANKKYIYVDGIERQNNTQTTNPTLISAPIEIGRYDQSAIRQYDGPIAQPRIYNRALTASEVLRNYNSGKNTYTNS